MTKRRAALCVLLSGGVCAMIAGCRPEWTATKIAVIKGLDHPESVAVDPATGVRYVTNVAPDPKKPDPARFWAKDGTGFLSRFKPSNEPDAAKWVVHTPAGPLHSPKGICLHAGLLHVADCDQIARFDPATGKPSPPLRPPGAKKLNDVLSAGGFLYASDTETGNVLRIGDDPNKPLVIPGPPAINGIAIRDGRMFAVSWGEHDVFELDPTGKTPPKAFGLADRLGNLDELKILEDGTMLVTDYQNNRIMAIAPDRKTVRTLIEVTTPADIGLDRKRMQLLVPAMLDNEVVVYQLRRQ